MGKKNRKKTTWRRLSLTGEEDGGAIIEDNERTESQYSDESNEQRHNNRYTSYTNNGRPPFYPHRNAHYRYTRAPKVAYSTDPSAPFLQPQHSVDGESETQDENYFPEDQFGYYPQYFPQFATPTLVLMPSYHPMQWQEDPCLPPDCQYYFCLTQPVPQQPPEPSSPPSTVDSGDNEADVPEQSPITPPEEEVDTGLPPEEYAYQTMPIQQPPLPVTPQYVYPGPFVFRPYAYNTNNGYYWWNEQGPSRGRRRRRRGFIGGEGITYDRWPSRKDRSCDRLKVTPVPNSVDPAKPSVMSANAQTYISVQLSEDAASQTHSIKEPLVCNNHVNTSNSTACNTESPIEDTPAINQTPASESKPLPNPTLSPSEPLVSRQSEPETSQLVQESQPTAMEQAVISRPSTTPDESIQDMHQAETSEPKFKVIQTEEHSEFCNNEENQNPQSHTSRNNENESEVHDAIMDQRPGEQQIQETAEMTNSSTKDDHKQYPELIPGEENSESDRNNKLHNQEVVCDLPQTQYNDASMDFTELSATKVSSPPQTTANESSPILPSPQTHMDKGTEIAGIHGKGSSSNPFKKEMESAQHSEAGSVSKTDSAVMQVNSQPWSKECSSNASSAPSERHHYHQLEDPMTCSKYYQLCSEVDDMTDLASPSNKPSIAALEGEIVMHEAADSASECGSEDVEMLGHRYETAAEKLYKTNALSLAVEMLNSNQQLPYDKEFKPVIEGGIANPCYANTHVLEGYYGQLKRKASNGKGRQGGLNGIRKDVADSGIHTDESGEEGDFRNTVHEDDEILFSRNRGGTSAFQYQAFGRRPRAEHSPLLYLRSKGPWHGCCCAIM